MVTGSADQTIRLWNLKTRELIVSMFFAGKEFVIWMPQGYYYSSDEGDKLIGWHVNQGRDKEGRFIRAGQLKKYLWSPEMVRRAIILKSAKQAVLEMRPGVDNELQRLLERKPPEFDVKLADGPERRARWLRRRRDQRRRRKPAPTSPISPSSPTAAMSASSRRARSAATARRR